ncbi:MAG: peptidase [Rhodobacteraceae bacterium]|nr:peptidase [Paracoccaceae bacterium]
MNKPLFPDVTVNGEVISAAEVAAEAQNHTAPAGKPGVAWRKAAQALVIRTLLLQEAHKAGVGATPQELRKGQVETDEEALIRAVMETGVTPDAVDEAAVRAAYDTNPDRFRAPALYEPAHILFAAAPENAGDREQALKRAQAALVILTKKPGAFADLAKNESDCPSREAGGHLGQIGPGDTVPEFESALAALEEGKISSEPVASRYGFHIIRLDAVAKGAALPFETVRPRLKEALEKAAWADAARRFSHALVARAEISGIEMGRP